MMHDEMGDRYGRRARKCGECDRQGRGSARSLRVFDLKAAVTPSVAFGVRRHGEWHVLSPYPTLPQGREGPTQLKITVVVPDKH